jgi:aryl-alcohol dehydrogenase-like predicted oxidoreductase
MKFRELGSTGYTVSAIAFGTWGIGGPGVNPFAYGQLDVEESKTALRKAFSLGISLYDTSCSYGDGRAELLLGEVFEKNRDKVIIATKAGYKKSYSANGNNQSFYWKDIERSIQDSLTKLRTNYIDIFQLHDCPLELIRDNHLLFEMLSRFKKEGIIRLIGFAGKSSSQTLLSFNIFEFDTVQIGLSLVDMRPIDEGLVHFCKKRGIGLIARSPLAFGFLTDSNKDRFGEYDHRSRFSLAQRERWISARKKFESVFSNIPYINGAQKALLFALSIDGVSSVNTGINASWQAKENSIAVEFSPLSDDKIREARQIYSQEYKDKPVERL